MAHLEIVDLGGSEMKIDDGLSAAIDEKKLLRKIDFKVMPMLFVIYVAAFLGRLVVALPLCHLH